MALLRDEQLNEVISFISDRFLERPSTRREHETDYSKPEPMRGGLSYRDRFVVG